MEFTPLIKRASLLSLCLLALPNAVIAQVTPPPNTVWQNFGPDSLYMWVLAWGAPLGWQNPRQLPIPPEFDGIVGDSTIPGSGGSAAGTTAVITGCAYYGLKVATSDTSTWTGGIEPMNPEAGISLSQGTVQPSPEAGFNAGVLTVIETKYIANLYALGQTPPPVKRYYEYFYEDSTPPANYTAVSTTITMEPRVFQQLEVIVNPLAISTQKKGPG